MSRRTRLVPRASRSCTRGRTRRRKAGGVRPSTSTGSRTTTSAAGRFANTPNLRAKYDVIIFGPGGEPGGHRPVCRCGGSRCRSRIHRRRRTSARGRRPTTCASAWGSKGLTNLRRSSKRAACTSARTASAEFAITNNFTYGVSANTPGAGKPRRRLAAADEARRFDASPIVYGVPDNLAMYSDNGEQFQRQRECRRRRTWRWGRWRRRWRRTRRRPWKPCRRDAARPTILTSCKDARRSKART